MLWTIIILGIKMFLRIEEALELTIEQFVEEYFQVTGDEVKALCAKIKGKRDDSWLHFMIWNDEDCPEFSASYAVLIWVELAGITSGRLFPRKEELVHIRSCGHTNNNLNYETFLGVMKHLLLDVLKRDPSKMENQIIGTHVLRKTAFLFANWGYIFHCKNRDNLELPPMEIAAILMSARHKEVSSTATYLDDSGTLQALVRRDQVNRDRHRIGRWEPIHMKAMDSFASILLESRKYQKPLPALAKLFVDRVCEGNTMKLSIPRIHEKATGYKPDLSLEEEIKVKLFKDLPPEKAEHLWQLHCRASADRVRAVQCTLPTGTNDDDDNNANKRAIETTGIPESNSTKKRKLDGDQNNVVRFVARDYLVEFNKARTQKEKVEVYVDAVAEVQAQVRDGKGLIDPVKSWSYRAGKVAQCIADCFGNDIDAFLAENHQGPLSKFKTCSKGASHVATFDRCKM
jgi:hypothetical protein